MNKIKVKAIFEEDEFVVGEFEPNEIQPIIDLFLGHGWISPEGDSAQATRVYLLVHDSRIFHVELT